MRVVRAVVTGVDVSRVPDARTYFKTVANELENSAFGSPERSWEVGMSHMFVEACELKLNGERVACECTPPFSGATARRCARCATRCAETPRVAPRRRLLQ